MSTQKPTYRKQHLTLAEAAKRVATTDDLLNALIDGVITSKGWFGHWPPIGPEESSGIDVPESKIIEPSIWKIAVGQSNNNIDWADSHVDLYDAAGWGTNLGISNITLPIDEFEHAFPERFHTDTMEPSRTGAPGRPSSMHLVEGEFGRRVAAGKLHESLAAESRYLAEWLRRTHPQEPPTTDKTIANRLRRPYRNAKLKLNSAPCFDES